MYAIRSYYGALKIVLAVFVSLSLVFGLLDNILHPDATSAIGICKAYTTRVGGGPFPTELEVV